MSAWARKTVVVKLGGGRLDDREWLSAWAAAARRVAEDARLCVVHGGGRDITRLLERLGIRSTWVAGLRVTSEADLEAVRMALSGSVNKRIVRALRDAGVEAVGISGEDGALWARLAPDAALGRVGQPESVGVELLETLLGAGLVPVVSPLARGSDGGGLNVNADEAAAAVAAALGADTLVFVTDVPGILLDGRPLRRVAARTLTALVERGAIHSGMLPKLSAAEAAAELVPDVRIGDLRCLFDPALGSRILASEAA
jgi:acetylglutamate kinase